MGKKRIVHLVSNAHIDPIWMWEWEDGAAEALSTFRTAADLCEEFPDFIFNHNEALLYGWIEEFEPELFARIQKLIKARKWTIMGGWYLQPDCNMPSGESFVRQILLGRRYFQEKFGVEVTTAANFDPFGHTRGLVQIMAKAGYTSYLFCRPGQKDCPLPADEFIWVGYDGSEVVSKRAGGYPTARGTAARKAARWIESHPDKETMLVLWGVGNHGGGPSRLDLKNLAKLMSQRQDVHIMHSSPQAYFQELLRKKASLPRYKKDLNPWAVGCYSSQIRVKQKHRLLENEIYSAEKMAASAHFQGLIDYPHAELEEAQRDLLLSEFHDALPGTSIQSAEDSLLRLLEHGLELASHIKTRAFFHLASGQPRAKEGEVPIFVFNPHPFRVKGVVECEFTMPARNWSDGFTQVTMHQGRKRIPCQVEKEASNAALDWRKKIAFQATLEPGQMNRFDCRLKLIPAKPNPTLKPSKGKIVFKNDEIEVVINTRTGLVDRYRVKGMDCVGKGAFQPLVIEDYEDPWGMQVRSFRKVLGRFKLMNRQEGARFSGVKKPIPSVRVIEDGAARSVVEAVFTYRHSQLCQRYKLSKVGTEVEVETRVYWNEKDHMLKLSIPTIGTGNKYIGQVAYGWNKLPTDGNEAVAQKWVAVVSRKRNFALTCINDGTYASDFSKDGLRITLLRSPAYSAHPIFDRPLVPPDRFTPRIDQGERLFRLWFNGGPLRERLDRIDREALVRNEKPFAFSFFPSGKGSLPKPLNSLSDSVVQIPVIKKSEDGDDVIIRLFEPTGKKRTTVLSLPFILFKKRLTLSAFELKTLRVNPRTRKLTEVNLLENPLSGRPSVQRKDRKQAKKRG